MKTFPPIKFILATFTFTWALFSIVIFSGQSNQDFPAMLLYILGGCAPSLVAIFFLWRTFNKEQRREFWSRVINPRRIKPVWWVISLVAIPAVMGLAVWLNARLFNILPGMEIFNNLKTQPAEIPVFIIMMLIGGPLAEELGWRGLLLDAFQKKWSPAISIIILFLIWWIWHLPLFFIPGTSHYDWGLFTNMFWLFAMNVFLLTVLMTLAYNANQRSVLIAILIHFSYNLTLGLLVPYTTQTFAFITTFLALLVGGVLITQNYIVKQQITSKQIS